MGSWEKVRFFLWKGQWLNGRSITSFMEIPLELNFTSNFIISEIIHVGKWRIPEAFKQLYPVAVAKIEEVQISDFDKDELVWNRCTDGSITVKRAYELYREKGTLINWKKKLSKPFIPPIT